MKNQFIEELALQSGHLRTCLDQYFGGKVAGLDEIRSLAEAGKIKRVAIAGMGSSYYAAFCVYSYLTQKGIPCLIINGFDAARYQWEQVDENTLVVGVSQSGKSWELNDFFKNLGGRAPIVGICNKEESLLNSNSDIKLPMFADTEVCFANRSFMHTIVVLNIMAHVITGDDLGALKAELEAFIDWLDAYVANLDANIAPMMQMVEGAEMFDFLGDGPSIAAAHQGGIIFREGPASKTASLTLADYAHDWILSVKPDYTEFLCLPEFKEEVEHRMLRRIMEKGGRAIVITANPEIEANDRTAVCLHPACLESLASLYQITVINYVMAHMLGEGYHR